MRLGDILVAFKAVVTTALPTHSELVNPYFPAETETDLALGKAFGISYAEGLNLLGNEGSGAEQRSRNFIVTLTRRKFATRGNTAARETTEKDLMNDWTDLVNAIAQKPDLDLPDKVERTLYVADDGIEFLRSEQNRNDILLIRTVFNVEYDEEVILCP